MLEVIFFLAVAGAYIWLFIHDRKLEKPVVNVTVNLPEQKTLTTENSAGNSTMGGVGTPNWKNTTTTGEIPIEVPKQKARSWKDIEITDSFDGK